MHIDYYDILDDAEYVRLFLSDYEGIIMEIGDDGYIISLDMVDGPYVEVGSNITFEHLHGTWKVHKIDDVLGDDGYVFIITATKV